MCTGQSIAATRKGNRNSSLLKVSISSFFLSLYFTSIKKLYPQESFHYSQLEKLLDIDSEFVALLKLEVIKLLFDHWLVYSLHHQVRPYNNRDTIEEYRMVLYRYHQFSQLNFSSYKLVLYKGSVTETTSTCRTSSCSQLWRTACLPWPLPSPRTTPQGSTLSPTGATSPTRGSGYSVTWSALSLEPTGFTH